MRILVVDDEADVRELMRGLLEQEGHKVTAAEDAVTAGLYLRLARFDLIVLDVMLPGMDGHQFAQSLSNGWNTFEIPVLMVSCRTDPESKGWAKLNGCVGYVEKPFSPSEFLDAVHVAGGKQAC